jgi:hypothetical protein
MIRYFRKSGIGLSCTVITQLPLASDTRTGYQLRNFSEPFTRSGTNIMSKEKKSNKEEKKKPLLTAKEKKVAKKDKKKSGGLFDNA